MIEVKEFIRSDVSSYFPFINRALWVEVECLIPHEGTIVGIDPGPRNLGIALFHDPEVSPSFIYQIELTRPKEMIERIREIDNLLHHLAYREDLFSLDRISKLVIEYAAHGAKGLQTELAEQRSACAIWFVSRLTHSWNEHNTEILTVPPTKIRKTVFGDGRTKAKEVWKDLPPDGADALGCAVYGALLDNRS